MCVSIDYRQEKGLLLVYIIYVGNAVLHIQLVLRNIATEFGSNYKFTTLTPTEAAMISYKP